MEKKYKKEKLQGVIYLATIRQLYTELVDYLKNIMFQKGILERPSYMELSKKLDFTYDWIKDKKDKLRLHYPQKKTFDDLFTRLSKKYKDSLENSWNTIENKFQNLYNTTFPDDSELPSSTSIINTSIKRQFFDSIKKIIKNYFPSVRIFDTDLSRIFFNRARSLKDSHLKGDYEFRKLEKSTLFNMIYKTRFLSKQSLVTKIRDIKNVKQFDLNNLKIDIENYIIDFIFSNPFDEKYINDSFNIGTSYFKPEFDLAFNIWFEISKAKNEPQILKHVRKLVSYDSLGRLTRGYIYSWDGIMNMLKKIIMLLPSEMFAKLFEQSWNYIEQRNLYLALPKIYHRNWYARNTIKFHVVMLIIRDLGLDILNLEPIDPRAFKKTGIINPFTFERHHIYINDKFSIDVNRLVLVMRMNHSKLEGKSDLILDLIKIRINLSLDCPIYYKNNVRNLQKRWQHYIIRRNYLIENGVEKFIIEFFTDEQGNNYILDRFFKNVPKGQIKQEIKKMMQEWTDKGRPTPIFNTYVLNRLLSGSPNLLTNRHIKIKF